MRRTMMVACATILSMIAIPVSAATVGGASASANPAARLAVADDGPAAPTSAVKTGGGHNTTLLIVGGLAAAGVIAGAVALGSHGSSHASN